MVVVAAGSRATRHDEDLKKKNFAALRFDGLEWRRARGVPGKRPRHDQFQSRLDTKSDSILGSDPLFLEIVPGGGARSSKAELVERSSSTSQELIQGGVSVKVSLRSLINECVR